MAQLDSCKPIGYEPVRQFSPSSAVLQPRTVEVLPHASALTLANERRRSFAIMLIFSIPTSSPGLTNLTVNEMLRSSMASSGSFGFVGSVGDSRRDSTISFLPFGKAHPLYRDATFPRCNAVLLLDVDPVRLLPIASRSAITS